MEQLAKLADPEATSTRSPLQINPDNMEDHFGNFMTQLPSLNEVGSLDAILSTISELALNDLDRAISIVQPLPPSSLHAQLRLWLLSHLFSLRHDETSDTSDLQQAISFAEAVLQPPHLANARIQHDLSILLYSRYETSELLSDLSESISLTETALSTVQPDDPKRIDMLEILSFRYCDRHQSSATQADISRAIALAQQVVEATPADHIHRGDRIMTLSSFIGDRYESGRDLFDLQSAITLAEQAIDLPCLYPSDLPKRYSNLAGLLFNRYKHLHTTQDLDEAVRLGSEGVSMADIDDPYRLDIINNLGNFVTERYDLLGRSEDLKRRNTLQAEVSAVVHARPEDDPEDPEELATLAELRWLRYQETRDIDDLQRATQLAEKALDGTTGDDTTRSQRLQRLGRFMWERNQRLEDSGDLTTAIGYTSDAIELMPPDSLHRVGCMTNLAGMLFQRYEVMEVMEDLDRAVEMAEETVSCTPKDDGEWAGRIGNVGFFLMVRYQEAGVMGDLERAITCTKASLAATQDDDILQAERLGKLGTQLRLRFELQGGLVDLNEAVYALEKAVAASPHPRSRLQFVANLATALHERYHRTGALADLDTAIRWDEEAVANAGDDALVRADLLQKLSSRLGIRYQRLGLQEDLEMALVRMTEAVSAMPEDHPERSTPLMNLSICYNHRFNLLGNVNDLDKAVGLAESALAAAPSGYPYRALCLFVLGMSHHARYERCGGMRDLEKATERETDALAATLVLGSSAISRRAPVLWDIDETIRPRANSGPHTNVEITRTNENIRPIVLCGLGDVHRSRYERLGDLDDVEWAVKRCKEALDATASNHPVRPMILSHLCVVLHARFHRLGLLDDLEQAIQLSDEALTSIPVDHPQRPSMFGDLATGLQMRYERLGNVKDLEQAMKITSDAPPKDIHQELALKSMGGRFWARYRRFQALEDLEKAIQWTEAALQLTPPGHRRRAETLENLGNMLSTRYQRMGTPNDLDQAIKWGEEALDLTPIEEFHHAGRLNSLSDNLGARYKEFGAVDDLQRALQLSKNALDMTPSDHPDRPMMLENSADLFNARYKLLNASGDLEAAIQCAKEAVEKVPLNDPYRCSMLNTLAVLLLATNPDGVDYSIHLHTEAWNCSTAPPTTRIVAAYSAAILLYSQERLHDSWSFLQKAVEMLSQVSPRWLQREDQQYILSKLGHLTAEALSIGLEAGEDPSRCLRLLELGRGIIIGLTIDCRSDISELREKHEHAFQKFNRLRTEIDSPYRSDKRREAIEEMEETLTYIRQLPGFSLFQQTPPPQSLMAIAHDGPLIIVNSTEYRSDAIVVTASAITFVELPKLSKEDVEARIPEIPKLAQGKRSTYPSRNKTLGNHLLWLWDVAVEPILNELKFGDAADKEGLNLPHVWWIGVGTLALAPFHAAGDHSPGSTRNTFSRVVSSYIPTIKALSYAREKRLELLSGSKPDSRLLLVTMPTTPGKRPLQNAELEAQEIMGEVSGRITATQLNRPSAADVLENIPQYHCIHFSCHGISDSANPSNSHLLLVKHDANLRSETLDHLTVGEISNTNINHAQLAYLSACSTARNSTALADESLHLAAAFQLAGFSHVLATMWQSNDSACRQVAKDFYRILFNGQRTENGHRNVRIAFHQAVKGLRAAFWRQPILWASYIHTGA